MPLHLISPYGGTLRDLLAGEERAHEPHECSRSWPSWDLSPERLCDLELLLTGALSPLDAEVVLDTTDLTPEEAAQEIVLLLERRGYVAAEKTGA